MLYSFKRTVLQVKEKAMSELIKERHRLVLRLSESERLTLQEGAQHHPHPQARERCAALLKVAEGHSPHWVARHGLLIERDPDSVYQWLHYYEQGGIAALLLRRHGGPHRRRLRPPRRSARTSAAGTDSGARPAPGAFPLELTDDSRHLSFPGSL